MKIAILGAGAYGTALGGILAEKGYDIDYYDSKLEREKLGDVLMGAKYIILSVPSRAVPYLLPHLPKDQPLIVATKGLLGVKSLQDFQDLMVMSGPGFADEIKAHKLTRLTVTDRRVAQLLSTDFLSFDFTDDVDGVLMCGALKNVYAIRAGQLKLKRNTAKWRGYIYLALAEMREILALNGAEPATVELACGRGDLELTCALPSRNYEFGLSLSEMAQAKNLTNELSLNTMAPEQDLAKAKTATSATRDLAKTKMSVRDLVRTKTIEGLTTLNKIKNGELKVPENATILRQLMEEKWV